MEEFKEEIREDCEMGSGVICRAAKYNSTKPNMRGSIEIPLTVFDLGLDPYESTLYYMYKFLAACRGTCCEPNKSVAKKCGMSEKKLKETKKQLARPRDELGGLPLIKITARQKENGGRTTDLIEITDIWDENFLHFLNKKT